MSDLNTMYNNGMGSLASYYMGQQQGDEQQKRALDLRAKELKNQFDAQANPLELRQKQATLDQMAAQLPGLQGQSASMVAKGVEDTSMLSSKMAAGLAKHMSQLGEEGITQMKQEGERAMQAAQVLQKYPPHMHKQIFTQLSQQYGGNPNGPVAKAILSIPDDQFLEGVKAMGEGMALATSQFTQTRTLKRDENESQERINARNNEAKVEAARLAAEARAKAEKLRAEARQTGLTPEKQLTSLLMIPEPDRTPADWDAIGSLQKLIYTKATLGSNSTTAEVLGSETPTDRAARLAQPNRPAAPPQAATPSGQDFKALAVQAWGAHEPDKYEYGINPATGRPARRPK
jgi:hypothetical protein